MDYREFKKYNDFFINNKTTIELRRILQKNNIKWSKLSRKKLIKKVRKMYIKKIRDLFTEINDSIVLFGYSMQNFLYVKKKINIIIVIISKIELREYNYIHFFIIKNKIKKLYKKYKKKMLSNEYEEIIS